MSEQTKRFPLSWPSGWKRTGSAYRRRAPFRSYQRQISVMEATNRLQGEMDRLQADGITLSTNIVLRLDGLPRSDQSEPSDVGAAVYFTLKKRAQVLACDKWDRVADNIAAIAAHVSSVRAVERYGVGTLDQVFAGYAALPPGRRVWWEVLGLEREGCTMDDVDEAFKAKAKEVHPDKTGDDGTAMAVLNEARENARKDLA